jgi:creatinine amidohydrolase
MSDWPSTVSDEASAQFAQDSAHPQYRHFSQSDSTKTDSSDEVGRSVCPGALESVRITGYNEFAGADPAHKRRLMPSPDAEILLPKLTRREFRERMQSGQLAGCIIPVAATEQHLEHLAMEHDWRSVLHIATKVATRLAPRVLITPSMSIGISEHHMRHAGTLSAMPGSWLGVLHDTIRSMHHAGFKNILVLNGHGGNIAPCVGMWGQFLQRFEINLQFHSYWDFLPADFAKAHLKTGRFPGHAQEFETAFALAAFPENVRHAAMADQTDREPLQATAEAGHALIEAIVEAVSRHMKDMLDGKNVAPIPPYMP